MDLIVTTTKIAVCKSKKDCQGIARTWTIPIVECGKTTEFVHPQNELVSGTVVSICINAKHH
jgi:hypothetical protein